MKINIKKIYEDSKIPSRGSTYSAGYDLYAYCLPDGYIEIPPHKTVKIGTGVAMELPAGYFGGIFARSGLATKNYLRPGNCTGVVDSDFRNEYIVALHNDSDAPQVINHGDRIAQLVVMPFLELDFDEVDILTETERGMGGFGSTGK